MDVVFLQKRFHISTFYLNCANTTPTVIFHLSWRHLTCTRAHHYTLELTSFDLYTCTPLHTWADIIWPVLHTWASSISLSFHRRPDSRIPNLCLETHTIATFVFVPSHNTFVPVYPFWGWMFLFVTRKLGSRVRIQPVWKEIKPTQWVTKSGSGNCFMY